MGLDGRGWILLIAIDTSAGTSAAVFDGDNELSVCGFDDPFGHAENIGSAITSALADAGISRSELTGVAVGIGPAPYTGLRVGIAAAQLLARSLQLPIYPVMVLDAIALGSTGKVLVTTDAKRKELFAATYSDQRRTLGPEVIGPERLAEFGNHRRLAVAANASMVGRYARFALANNLEFPPVEAIYLRSPDVTASKGKRVSG